MPSTRRPPPETARPPVADGGPSVARARERSAVIHAVERRRAGAGRGGGREARTSRLRTTVTLPAGSTLSSLPVRLVRAFTGLPFLAPCAPDAPWLISRRPAHPAPHTPLLLLLLGCTRVTTRQDGASALTSPSRQNEVSGQGKVGVNEAEKTPGQINRAKNPRTQLNQPTKNKTQNLGNISFNFGAVCQRALATWHCRPFGSLRSDWLRARGAEM